MSVNWLSRAVSQAARLHPYVPGKPVERLLAEKGIREAVKLASNENPFGPSPKAVAAARRAAETMHRYPDGDATALRQALAERHGVTPAHVLVGNGSNEVLELLIRTFAGPGDAVV
ncbi:MAG: aminotransferase class I/II-fold pyridoxal phosphate-dependent enzyme, partial [Planctomycetota bacterium]